MPPDAPRRLDREVDDSLLAGGEYARKQLFSRSRIVAYSHGARFRVARRLVQPFVGGALLDYGCGDGTFLALVRDLFPVAVGVDADPRSTSNCVKRFADLEGLSFTLTDTVRRPEHAGAYRVVTCMETLEHCPAEERATVLADLRRLVAPDGRVIISVPIEIGPSLIGKHLFRMVAAWRRLGDYRYRETLRPAELFVMVFATARTVIERPVYKAKFPGGTVRYHGHKGFNWRALASELRPVFALERRLFSPLPWFGPVINSQAWFVCRPC